MFFVFFLRDFGFNDVMKNDLLPRPSANLFRVQFRAGKKDTVSNVNKINIFLEVNHETSFLSPAFSKKSEGT